jgi:hypothetical protein
MKVHRPPKKAKENADKRLLDARVAHCLGCGRIWVQDRDIGSDECSKCGHELYPVVRNLTVGEELRLGDGYEARVSQDGLLRAVASTFRALIDQSECSCQPGVQCAHCRAKNLLRDFPGPAEGTMEDDWNTLRGRKPADPSAKPKRELSTREQRLMQDILEVEEAADAYRDTEDEGPDPRDPGPDRLDRLDRDFDDLLGDF